MPAKTIVVDGKGTGNFAGVTPTGELLVAGFGNLINKSIFQSMNAANAAFNFFGPIAGQQFVITSIVLDGPNAATVSVYEAASQFTVTIDKLLFKINFRGASNQVVNFPFGGFLAVSEGEYVNALTDTTTVNMNIIGYYSPINIL